MDEIRQSISESKIECDKLKTQFQTTACSIERDMKIAFIQRSAFDVDGFYKRMDLDPKPDLVYYTENMSTDQLRYLTYKKNPHEMIFQKYQFESVQDRKSFGHEYAEMVARERNKYRSLLIQLLKGARCSHCLKISHNVDNCPVANALHCTYCKKSNHVEKLCYSKARK